MKKFNKIIFLTLFIFLSFVPKVFCSTVWNNDLKTLFLSNKSIIYVINLRTFNAKDKNGNGIIEEEAGEERGTFLNAIDRLDELVKYGINTIQLLPVTSVGKTKALGTAGSLYAASSFNELNPQLKSSESKLSLYDEMKLFVEECHKRNIRVIADLPCCASYDLYLKKPELFAKDKNQNPLLPVDWTDVRLLDAGLDEQLNIDVYNLYANFIDLMEGLNVDGIRASIATTKSYFFWKKLIDKTRKGNPQFLFIAEVSPLSKKVSDNIAFTPYEKLLEAGFDGYYGSYSELRNWRDSKDLFASVESDIKISKKYSGNKRVLGNFSTHDQISPILINGPQFSKMIIWLSSTLPLNSYYIDGFPTGDNYIYSWANRKAPKTFTDDDYYFVHRGQLDIFNFSRKPSGKHYDILQDFIIANKFKNLAKDILSNGNFIPLKVSSQSVFAYARSYNKETIIVIGNLNFKETQNVKVKVPKINNDLISIPIKISSIPKILKGEINTSLAPGEVQVLLFNLLEVK